MNCQQPLVFRAYFTLDEENLMFYGLLNLSFWGYVILTLAMTQLTVMAVTLYLHRCQAHRGIDMHPFLSHIFRFWLWLTTGMETKQWVAIHRKHHAHCETEQDPHSPQLLGLRTVMWQGAELYRKACKDKATLEKFGKGTPDDWMERNVYTRYPALGLLLMAVLDVALLGFPGIIVWAIQMAWIPLFAAGLVNGLAHFWGYRNYECTDAATNLWPIGIIVGGEELHNNHHTFGTSAKFSVKWWEFDIGWLYIKIFSLLNLVKVRRVATHPVVIKDKTQIDVDTLTALVRHRFQILSRYSKEVMLPIFDVEKAKLKGHASKLFCRSKRALIAADELVDAKARETINAALSGREQLALAYQYRQKLQAIWARTTATQKELIDALQEWCRQAEATGVEVLAAFARRLKTYSVQPKAS